MIDKIVVQDWDNFKNLKEFVAAEELSKNLQKKIHDFHESFLISKTHSIEELVNIPNINWLYIRKREVFDYSRNRYFEDGTYEIVMHGASFKTNKTICREAGTGHRYTRFIPNKIENDFQSLIDSKIKYLFWEKNTSSNLLSTKEIAESKCNEYNELLRHDITKFLLYQEQKERFILDSNNSPIAISCGGSRFEIDTTTNQLIVSTTFSGYEYKIDGYGNGRSFSLISIQNSYDLVFDISTNNLIKIIKK